MLEVGASATTNQLIDLKVQLMYQIMMVLYIIQVCTMLDKLVHISCMLLLFIIQENNKNTNGIH